MPGAVKISVTSGGFDPRAATAKVGQVVSWKNTDTALHTVTFNVASLGGSGDLAKGEEFAHTFAATGVYHYHCDRDKSLTGTVTVT